MARRPQPGPQTLSALARRCCSLLRRRSPFMACSPAVHHPPLWGPHSPPFWRRKLIGVRSACVPHRGGLSSTLVQVRSMWVDSMSGLECRPAKAWLARSMLKAAMHRPSSRGPFHPYTSDPGPVPFPGIGRGGGRGGTSTGSQVSLWQVRANRSRAARSVTAILERLP